MSGYKYRETQEDIRTNPTLQEYRTFRTSGELRRETGELGEMQNLS